MTFGIRKVSQRLTPEQVVTLIVTSVLQEKRNRTKTLNRKELSNHSREFLMKGPLKWETDLYIFVRALFNERLRRYDITPTGVQITWSHVNIPEMQQSLFIQDHDSKEKKTHKRKNCWAQKFYKLYFYQSSQQM